MVYGFGLGVLDPIPDFAARKRPFVLRLPHKRHATQHHSGERVQAGRNNIVYAVDVYNYDIICIGEFFDISIITYVACTCTRIIPLVLNMDLDSRGLEVENVRSPQPTLCQRGNQGYRQEAEASPRPDTSSK